MTDNAPEIKPPSSASKHEAQDLLILPIDTIARVKKRDAKKRLEPMRLTWGGV